MAWLKEILWLTWLLNEHRLRLLRAHIRQLRRGWSCGLREQNSINLAFQVADFQILLLQLELVLGFQITVPLVKFSKLGCHLLDRLVRDMLVHLESLAPLGKLLTLALVVLKSCLQVAYLLLLLLLIDS